MATMGIIWLAVVTGGCDSSAAVTEFHDLLTKQGEVVFLSWNGKWIGMDGDTKIRFLPARAVEMTEYGFAIQHYGGTYQVDSDGTVLLQLEGFSSAWPAMVLERDAKSLLLRPKDGKQGFVVGGRGGATVRGEDGSYWPFRQVERRPFDLPASQPSE